MLTIGVLALQGDFAEHESILKRLGATTRQVRMPADLDGVDGLIIPGGESTTITRLINMYGLYGPTARVRRLTSRLGHLRRRHRHGQGRYRPRPRPAAHHGH